jgi:hypothetical protein
MHQQLYHYDASRADGNNVGANKISTAAPGKSVSYQWYVGDIYVRNDGTVRVTPVEFGATNILPADRIKQPSKGLFGASIANPQGSTYVLDPADSCGWGCEPPRWQTRATVTKSNGQKYREFVLFFQNFLNLRFGDGSAIPNVAENEDAEDSGHKAFNYRTEPMWFRMGYAPEAPATFTRNLIFTDALSNSQVGGDPETPVFEADAGEDVRFRVVHPGGNQRNNVFALHGHIWQRQPYVNDSSQIGNNPHSMWQGSRMGVGPTDHFDAVLENGAGGKFRVTGDYLYRDMASFQFDAGLWGLFRVTP